MKVYISMLVQPRRAAIDIDNRGSVGKDMPCGVDALPSIKRVSRKFLEILAGCFICWYLRVVGEQKRTRADVLRQLSRPSGEVSPDEIAILLGIVQAAHRRPIDPNHVGLLQTTIIYGSFAEMDILCCCFV